MCLRQQTYKKSLVEHETDRDTKPVGGVGAAASNNAGHRRYGRLGMGEPKPAAAVHHRSTRAYSSSAHHEQESIHTNYEHRATFMFSSI